MGTFDDRTRLDRVIEHLGIGEGHRAVPQLREHDVLHARGGAVQPLQVRQARPDILQAALHWRPKAQQHIHAAPLGVCEACSAVACLGQPRWC